MRVTDFRGSDIERGSLIVYPSQELMIEAVVEKVHQPAHKADQPWLTVRRIRRSSRMGVVPRGMHFEKREVTVKALERVTVVPRGQVGLDR